MYRFEHGSRHWRSDMATTSPCPFHCLFLQLLDFLLKFLASQAPCNQEMRWCGLLKFHVQPSCWRFSHLVKSDILRDPEYWHLSYTTQHHVFQAMSTGNVLQSFNVLQWLPKSVLFGSGRTSCISSAISAKNICSATDEIRSAYSFSHLCQVSINMIQPHLYCQISREANSCDEQQAADVLLILPKMKCSVISDPEIESGFSRIRHSTLFANQSQQAMSSSFATFSNDFRNLSCLEAPSALKIFAEFFHL